MRFYGFGNYYLSSLQQGLQSAHAIGELFTQYDPSSVEYKQVHDWGKNHKTMVLLNGGNSASLQELFNQFTHMKERGMQLPFAKFHEDEQSLGGALTYVGIVIPAKYYEVSAELRNMTGSEAITHFAELGFEDWEKELVSMMNNYRLAS